MAEMSMNKVIHGAVRRDLDRFVVALDHFPSGDRARAADLSRAWENFDEQLTYHHEGEHRIAWPALQKVGVASDEGPAAIVERADVVVEGVDGFVGVLGTLASA